MCERWWDLPRNIKKLLWPRYGLELCLVGKSPSVLLLHFWLINVPGEVGLVVRKPTIIARLLSIRDAFFQSINYD